MSLDRRLVGAIIAEDPEQVRDLLTAATEQERRSADEPLREQLGRLIPPRDPLPGRRRAALLAILGTSTTTSLRAFGLARYGIPVAPAVAVLEARPAAIRRAMLKAATSDTLLRWLWPVAFDFVRRDQLTRPDTVAYAEGALSHVFGVDWRWPIDPGNPTDEQWIDHVRERLSDHELSDELLAVLRHEGRSSGCRRPAAGPSRRRSSARPGTGRSNGPACSTSAWTVTYATSDPRRPGCSPVCGQSSRQAPTNSPRGRTASCGSGHPRIPGASPSRSERSARCWVTALSGIGHPRTDVQEASLAFVERLVEGVSDPVTIRQELLAWAETVEPQLRGRLEDLTGVATPESEPGTNVDRHEIARRFAALSTRQLSAVGLDGVDPTAPRLPPPVRFDPWAPPVLTPERALTPIDDPVELVEAVVAWLSGPVDGIDVERVLDGLARLGADSAGSAATSAVRAQRDRLRATLGSLADATPTVWLTDAWLDRRPPQRLPFVRRRGRWLGGRTDVTGDLVQPRVAVSSREHRLGLAAFDGLRLPAHPAAFGAVRMWELAQHLADGRVRPLLATPTHQLGWIAPAQLCDRLEEMQRRRLTPDRFDAVQALLRMAPSADHDLGERLLALGTDPARAAAGILGQHTRVRDEALRRASRIRIELGRPAVSRRPGREPHHAPQHALRWRGIADIGDRRRDDPVGVTLAALATPPEEIHWWHDMTVLLAGADHAAMSHATTALPRFPDLYGAAVATTVVFDLGANRSSDADHIALAALLDADVPLDAGAHAGLATALTARNETLATVAVDLTIAAVDDGRLDLDLLGELLAAFANEGFGLLARPAPRLSIVAEHSLLHADAVRRVWIAALAALDVRPRDLHAPLEGLLAAAARCRRGVDDGDARSFVESVATGNSKRARLARSLLALPTAWDDTDPELLAITGRLTRAERWAAPGSDTTGSTG